MRLAVTAPANDTTTVPAGDQTELTDVVRRVAEVVDQHVQPGAFDVPERARLVHVERVDYLMCVGFHVGEILADRGFVVRHVRRFEHRAVGLLPWLEQERPIVGK
ncbi:MAG: hypothetical protein AAGD32_07780 [Planctomycetota bacterium]